MCHKPGSSVTPASLRVDNKSAIDLAYNPEHHDRTKHILRRHFFVRELVESGEITVSYVITLENLGDFFTKPLAPLLFFPMRDIIMNIRSDAPPTPAPLLVHSADRTSVPASHLSRGG